jgi:predicted transcriptional regulator YdeE
MMVKKVILRLIMKRIVKKNMLSAPKVIQLPAIKFKGYSITTTLKDNQQKADIPPFYHDIYDNKKLVAIKPDGEFRVFCIFNMHKNQEDFDYYVAVEAKSDLDNDGYAKIQTREGKYIQVELLKRNNKTVAMIMMYIRTVWMKKNGWAEKNAPSFIVYDERFHANYQKFGCKGNDYMGEPYATLFLPVKD